MSGMISPIGPENPMGSLGSIASLPGTTPAGGADAGFSGMLTGAIEQVDQLNSSAQQQIGTLLTNGNSDLSSVMVAVEKADVAFQLMMQVRNKIVSAYQDIEKMQF